MYLPGGLSLVKESVNGIFTFRLLDGLSFQIITQMVMILVPLKWDITDGQEFSLKQIKNTMDTNKPHFQSLQSRRTDLDRKALFLPHPLQNFGLLRLRLPLSSLVALSITFVLNTQPSAGTLMFSGKSSIFLSSPRFLFLLVFDTSIQFSFRAKSGAMKNQT